MESIDVDIKPLAGYVLIEPFYITDHSEIELPPSLQKNRNMGTVVAVCDTLSSFVSTAVNPKAIEVAVGDKIYVKDYIDKPIEIFDTKYFFVNYEDILGIQK